MQVFEKIKYTREFINARKAEGKTIGFVPTMGALHEGHLSLVDQAKKETHIIVVSVFVNPAQFNNPDDLQKYPRDMEGDMQKLKQRGVDVVFAPSEQEMYPEKTSRTYDFGHLDKVMEGKHRPGHFNGVALIVHKLFDIIHPDKAFFGNKDYQQLVIIKQLTRQENLPVEVVGCPILREPDGLAMSSRNQRLTQQERKIAPVLYQTLKKAVELRNHQTVDAVKRFVTEEIKKTKAIELEYFDIADSNTLTSINKWSESDNPRGFIAAWLGDVRLIDNMAFN
ncbi:MAG: pantoate--beta-alanine ligase [Bacteroidales bacterium]|nr:pantoate--beta-alanine ligase [Bacteroidales bacterium]MCF8334265.1 pantoate--beta-alanine ligase [Bacteroidales bacterium]